MSMVVFPFRAEPPALVLANLATAARHPRVTSVVAIGAERGEVMDAVSAGAAGLSSVGGAVVTVTVQERIGDRRPGKGDAMNTGLRMFVESREGRLHFYDADITNFGAAWIDGAERAADRGAPVVRHSFPRASTDAMVTWLVTRPGFALTHPASPLWRVAQPLGGELLLTRDPARSLVDDTAVAARSDWGIDTVITHATLAAGFPVHEHYVASGKQHALYGSLVELRLMLIECFEAIVDLSGSPVPPTARLTADPPGPVPPAVADKVAYDVESTLPLLTARWEPGEVEAAAQLPRALGEGILGNLVRPTFSFMTAEAWGETLRSLLDLYRPAPGWRSLLFRLWLTRVLAYTTTDALAGHARAMRSLERAVTAYAGGGHRAGSAGP